jgi:3D (Asp-Asp-Asp) domain-containing protein
MKKIKITKEGMWLTAPILAGALVFGTLAHEAWEQDKQNQEQSVLLEQAKDKLEKYEKANHEFSKQNKHLRRIVEMMDSKITDLNSDNKALKTSVEKLKQDRTLYLDGKVYIARQEFTASATAYTQRDEEGTADGRTKTGTYVKEGRTIAVDPRYIPLGSIVYIESESPLIGGFYIAEDTGSAIKGAKIDIFMNDIHQALRFGKQKIKVTVLEGADL